MVLQGRSLPRNGPSGSTFRAREVSTLRYNGATAAPLLTGFMNSILGLQDTLARGTEEEDILPTTPALLLKLEPWGATFLKNLADALLFRRQPDVELSSEPGAFWPDVFVSRRLPWIAFAESLLYHGIVLAAAWWISSILPPSPKVVQVRRFDPADVIYYSPSEYLPPLDTGVPKTARAQKGDPVLAKQPILSVPPEADNRRQTIVTPPNVKLDKDVEIPNVVVWGDHSVPVPGAAIERKSSAPALNSQIVAPTPEMDVSSQRNVTGLSSQIVAPAPAVGRDVRVVGSMAIDVVAPAPDAAGAGTRSIRGLQSAVVEPPPAINAASVRKLGDVNIGHSEVVAPAPQLAVEAQRTLPSMGSGGRNVVAPPPAVEAGGAGVGQRGGSAQGIGGTMGGVVPPPPSVEGPRNAEAGGHLIALGIHPAVTPPAEPPRGNRRGTFAAGPEGKTEASGTPEVGGKLAEGIGAGANSGSRAGAGSGTGTSAANHGLPSGMHVGVPANAVTGSGDPETKSGTASGTEMASATAPHGRPDPSPSPRAKAEPVDNPSQLERQVFRDRRLYRMTQNMPNLNSAGGSWVIRFAELNAAGPSGELSAPIADHKVDPAYPLQLMRENVSGTVTLRAIIRADGSVSDIQVVNGADPRLDRYASQAFARWHFLPAMKNEASVDVEAIVIIPFKPILRKSAF
jgi:TonB family protein